LSNVPLTRAPFAEPQARSDPDRRGFR
jgi:hypothetical protein